MRYAFPCMIVPDEEEREATGREAYVVTFPDVPEAITGGDSSGKRRRSRYHQRRRWPRTVWA